METVLYILIPRLVFFKKQLMLSSDPHYVETPTLKPQSGGQPQTTYIEQFFGAIRCYQREVFFSGKTTVCPSAV